MRKGIELDNQTDKKIENNANRLKKGNVFLQFFAIFIDPDIPSDEQWQHASEQVDLFYSEIIEKQSNIKHIKQWDEISLLQEGEIGAVLTMEGDESVINKHEKQR